MKRYRFAVLLLSLLALSGCSSGPAIAPVSGVITLDGKPYDKAVVSFQPIGTKENPTPGVGSSAYTDENGRYELVLQGGDRKGAIVGRHRVRIMTKGNDVMIEEDTETGSEDETPVEGRVVDPIPPEWNALSDKEFEVTSGGTDKANFDIVSRSAKGKQKGR